MSLRTSYHAESDADDEFERSTASPRPNSDISALDSEAVSAESTPTFGRRGSDYRFPSSKITEWTAGECADFLVSIGLRQYCKPFLENEIVGEALVALKHDELKEMGIASVGHRLTILKSVYETKTKQDVPLDTDHYIPLSADQSMGESASQDDIARLIQSIRLRDEKIASVEAGLRRMADDYRRLREELLPVFKMAKDRSQPLPPPDGFYDGQPSTSPQGDRYGMGVSRTYSKKMYAGESAPKNSSPGHIPPLENRLYNDGGTLDPSTAVSNPSGGSHPSPGMPSPTSPNAHHTQHTLASRSYTQPSLNANRSVHDHADDLSAQRPERPNPTPAQQLRTDPLPRIERRAGTDPPSVEVFKSFRISLEDPCHKVLPAALKKYNIHDDWKQYALYIVYGDQERCLAMDERPLTVFKQLDKEGKKPMFMLRKNLYPMDSAYPPSGSGGSAPNSAGFGGSRQAQANLPGGVL